MNALFINNFGTLGIDYQIDKDEKLQKNKQINDKMIINTPVFHNKDWNFTILKLERDSQLNQ